MKNIAVLITCHNRIEKTLSCLKHLFEADVSSEHILEVFLVDDGSTDGTSSMVSKQFPTVKIYKGNGNLYWNGGMYLAWEYASNEYNYDYYLWLNDDTFIEKITIEKLIESAESLSNKSIICACIRSLDKKKWTYGGFKMLSRRRIIKLLPNGHLQACDLTNGNCVLVPKFVFESVGNLDPIFSHAIGDFDYSLRAKKLGVQSFVSAEYLGYCDQNPLPPNWCLPEVPLYKRIKNLYSPLGNSHPKLFFIFELRHRGIIIAIEHFITIHLRLLFPFMWKR